MPHDAAGLVADGLGLWRGMGHTGPGMGRGRRLGDAGCMGTRTRQWPPTGLILGIDTRRGSQAILGLPASLQSRGLCPHLGHLHISAWALRLGGPTRTWAFKVEGWARKKAPEGA